MWKKNDARTPDEPQAPALTQTPRTPMPQQPQQPQHQPQPAQQQSQAAPPRSGAAVIGPSITVKGDVIGEEDLVIEGRVEGEIKVNRHSVTVGRNGRIQADIHAKSVQVEGEVLGNLWGDEAVVIRRTGKVQGNVTAPRVTLEDGSTFRGSIDMQPPQGSEARKAQESEARKAPESEARKPAESRPMRAEEAAQRRERTA